MTEENKQKRSIVELALHYRQIVILVTACLVAFGIYGLAMMNKNEFPDCTVRQGLVIAVYPGASSMEVEEQVTKPLEDYIFTYKEVRKDKTKSYSRNGMAFIQVELNTDIDGADKDNFWSRMKLGVQALRQQLPIGVVAVIVNDDFGDTSALLITMESEEKTYRELKDYMDDLKDRLRQIESVGRLTVTGELKEQISVYLDAKKLSRYGISQNAITAAVMTKGLVTTAGTQKQADYEAPIHVERSLNMVNDVEQLVVFSDPAGHVVRLKDVATVKREYAAPSSYITNNGKKCLLLSVEMKKGRNITEMGADVKRSLAEFQRTLPEEVSMFTITDQSKVVSDSVVNFLKELLIAILAVVVVVMLLLPMRVALVAASTIPISIFISLGLFYAFGIELNIVTLAALIVTLGMIVDNSIVIIDNYMELIGEGMPRWQASIQSATHFFKSILSATLAISVTFFPLLLTITGTFHDFILLFPWAITIVLAVSLFVAELLVPFMQFFFIRKPVKNDTGGKKAFSFVDWTQAWYNKLIATCFRHPYLTIGAGVMSVAAGILLIALLPQKMMPFAERNQLAVEIYLPTGTSLSRTTEVADSLEHILRQDPRVVSVASFHGTSSPRFQSTYAPKIGGKNFAQFIVNTTGNDATVGVLHDYRSRYATFFPDAYVRFKQMSYSLETNSVELRLSGSDWTLLKRTADSLTAALRQDSRLMLVRNDAEEPLLTTDVKLDERKASRMGVSNIMVELMMASRYNSDGTDVATVWDGDYSVPVRIKSTTADSATIGTVGDELLPVLGGLRSIPLRQVATITPRWEDGQIGHRNGVRTITVMADVEEGINVMALSRELLSRYTQEDMPEGVTLV